MIESFSIIGAVLSMAGFQFIDLLIKFKYSKIFKNTKNENGNLVNKIMKVINTFKVSSIILLGASIINAVVFWWVRLFMSELPNGFSVIAKFDTAFQFILLEMLVMNTLVSVLIPDLVVRDYTERQNIRRLLKITFGAIVVSATMSFSVHLLADYLIMLFGHKFTSETLKTMTIIPIVYSVALLCNRYMVVIDKVRPLLFVSMLSALFMIFYVLFYVEGDMDIASAFSLYYFVSICVYQIYLLRIYVNHK
jgi:hypothetical protein